MGRESLLGNLHLVGEHDLVDEVEIVALDGEGLAGENLGRAEGLDGDRLGIAEEGLAGEGRAVGKGQHGIAGSGGLFRDRDADLGVLAGGDHFDVGDHVVVRNRHGDDLVQIRTDEAELSPAHHGLRAVSLKDDGVAFKLLGAQLVLVAGRGKQRKSAQNGCKLEYLFHFRDSIIC